MSDRNFSRRRRGGMRFRPSGGIQNRPDRAASDARAEALGDKQQSEHVFDSQRHEEEIERAENMAAGLPPEGVASEQKQEVKRDFRKPNLETPAEVKEFEPVPLADVPPKGIVDSIKAAAAKVFQKVQ